MKKIVFLIFATIVILLISDQGFGQTTNNCQHTIKKEETEESYEKAYYQIDELIPGSVVVIVIMFPDKIKNDDDFYNAFHYGIEEVGKKYEIKSAQSIISNQQGRSSSASYTKALILFVEEKFRFK